MIGRAARVSRGRIVLLRFSLAEVEQPTEDVPAEPMA